MLQFVRSKIEQLQYVSRESKADLYKLLRISKFTIQNSSRSFNPPLDEYQEAINELNAIEENPLEIDFYPLKKSILNVYDKLEDFIRNNEFHKSKPVDALLLGKNTANANTKIEFALLLVEQNNIDFFKSRPAKLPHETHDRFRSHYVIVSDPNGSVSLLFSKEDTPLNIKNEAIEAAKAEMDK